MTKISKDGSKFKTDEKFNYLSHLFGSIIALYGTVFLIINSSSAWEYVSFSIYGITLISLFLASTFHHGYNGSKKLNKVLLKLDYSAVFLLIAGSLTPICLVLLKNKLGWSIFGIIWFLAILGITLKCTIKKLSKKITNLLFLTMGWAGIFLIKPLFNLSIYSFILLLVGGLFYTIGAIIFAIEKPNPIPNKFGFHEIWHIFVLLGAISHYFLMYLYILPL